MLKLYCTLFITWCLMWSTSYAVSYPPSGVAAFSEYSDNRCLTPYRGRGYAMMAPKLNVCYKCGGKAIRYEQLTLFDGNGGNVRQCINLNNDCGGSFTCTDIVPYTCVPHPCISGPSVYGQWFNQLYEGYHVFPNEDATCSDTSSLPMPYYYMDMGGFCQTFDNDTSIVPNNPKCIIWTSNGDDKMVNVCKTPTATCTGSSSHIREKCSVEQGASCVMYATDAPGLCVDGRGWPLITHPGATVKYVPGHNAFGVKDASSTRITTSLLLLTLTLVLAM